MAQYPQDAANLTRVACHGQIRVAIVREDVVEHSARPDILR